MPSSPTPPAAAAPTRHQRLLSVLDTVPDPRDRRGIRYPLAGVLALAVTATIAGAHSFTAIGQWAATATAEHLAEFGLARATAPDESTLRKLFARLDGDALDTALGMWVWTRTFHAGGRRVIALDGKTVRGARDRSAEARAPHLVAAFDHGAAAVLGQVAVDAKSNEIPAARTLLSQFDLHGVTVTLDALHTQTATAEQITSAGGDYVLTVKRNTPTLHRNLAALPWNHVPATRATNTGRGRRVTRTIKVADVPAWIDFPEAAQVAQVRRTVTGKNRRKSVEVVYLITSADHAVAPPAVLAAWVRGHWGIEALHHVRDVTFGEDLSQVRTGQTPRIMASCRNLAVSMLRIGGWTNIAAGLRHHARWPDDALTLAPDQTRLFRGPAPVGDQTAALPAVFPGRTRLPARPPGPAAYRRQPPVGRAPRCRTRPTHGPRPAVAAARWPDDAKGVTTGYAWSPAQPQACGRYRIPSTALR